MTKRYLTANGARTAKELFGLGGAKRFEGHYARRATHVDESWARLSADWVMNGMYSRGVLSSGVRELCAVAALTALASEHELRDHIRMALRTNKAVHVREAILQMAVYAGMPAALAGARIFDAVLEEPEFRRIRLGRRSRPPATDSRSASTRGRRRP
jgi:4-carboxymuconolactone decarboxylase